MKLLWLKVGDFAQQGGIPKILLQIPLRTILNAEKREKSFMVICHKYHCDLPDKTLKLFTENYFQKKLIIFHS